jgi:glutamine amidotransferase
MGNLRSVANAFEAIGNPAEITAEPEDLRSADGIVLPGVGAFGDGMQNLEERGFLEVLETEVRQKRKPLLGLCLGMQLLASGSSEHGAHPGLGWIPGMVTRLEPADAALRVPHIGWNDVRFTSPNGLFSRLGDAATFYFVHSYVFRPTDPSVVSGTCDYGGDFPASVECENLYGTQFHPEKSQRAGLAVLERFVELC